MKKKNLLFVLCLLAGSLLQAQTWDGSASTDWNTPANWSTNAVPISTGAVIIPVPGVITNWPVMANNVTIGRITLNSGSQLNTAGFNITLTTGAGGGCDITGAVITNPVPANTTLISVPNGGKNINGSTFHGNFHFSTTSANQTTSEGVTAANTWNGNTTFTILAGEALLLCENFPSVFNGNLTVNRPADPSDNALMNLFQEGGFITGNFTLNYDDEARLFVGTNSKITRINGQLNMNINNIASSMQIIGLKNYMAGGSIVINNLDINLNIREDSLLVNTISISQPIFNTTIDTSYIQAVVNYSSASGNSNQFISTSNTTFTGDVNFSMSAGLISDANVKGCNYLGNASFTGRVSISNTDTSVYYKNLTATGPGAVAVVRGIKFAGNTDGAFTNTGTAATPFPITTLRLLKTGGAKLTLNSPTAITTRLDFSGGNIISTTANYLRFANNAIHANASNTSHVKGPVQKTGDDAFTFPTGTDTTLNTVAMTAPTVATDRFSAEYNKQNPHLAGFDTSQHAGSLQRISGCEYWDIQRQNGASNVTLTFSFAPPCSGGPGPYISNPAAARIARWTGSTWENLGNGGSTGTTTGTITTAAAVTTFSPFTFGSADIILNPLPVTLLNFAASKCNSGICLLWVTENEQTFSHFEVEKSADGRNFAPFNSVTARNTSGRNSYTSTDNNPVNGDNFYRLKIIDPDGSFKYSKVIKINLSKPQQVSLLPNPATDFILLNGVKDYKLVRILDFSGKVKQQQSIRNSIEEINISRLPAGIYLVQLSGDKEITTIKLIKQ